MPSLHQFHFFLDYSFHQLRNLLLFRVWKNVVHRGDTVIDATCGNGHDTLALVKMVADKFGKGLVYGLDIQQSAIDSTSSLLEMSTEEHEVFTLKPISHY